MPGPSGETCAGCYFWEENAAGLPNGIGLCRGRLPENVSRTQTRQSLAHAGRKQPHWSPTDGDADWCESWKDRTAPETGNLATAGLITPKNTPFVIPGGEIWTHFNPGTMYASSIVHNATAENDEMTWSIPGVFDPSTVWAATYSMFGSVEYQNSADGVEWTLGDDTNQPFTDDVAQRMDISGQLDDLALPLGFAGGPALSAQTGNIRIICKAQTEETITVRSLYCQFRVERL